MIIGAVDLLEKYGSRIAIAEALLDNKLSDYEIEYARSLLDENIRWAAGERWRAKLPPRQEEK